MKSYSCFISRGSDETYYSGDKENLDPYLGRPDGNNDRWVCGMPSEEADALLARHTNEDGSIDTRGMEKDIGFHEGTFDEGITRIDYEADEERPTQKGGPNDNDLCTGDGKLPGGDSDLEMKNVPRENITNNEEITGAKDYQVGSDIPNSMEESYKENDYNPEEYYGYGY